MLRIVWLLLLVWWRFPQLRLMQLLGNIWPDNDYYYKTNDEVERALRTAFEQW